MSSKPTHVVAVLAMVAVLITAPVGLTGALSMAQTTPTVTVDAPDSIDVGADGSGSLIVEDVAERDDIGAYELNITYNSSALALDASGTDTFDVSTNRPEAGVLTVVGYTDQSETAGGTLSLAALTVTGNAAVAATDLSVTVTALSDTDGNDIPHETSAESLSIVDTTDGEDGETGDGDDGTDGGDGTDGSSGPGGGGAGPGGGGAGGGAGDGGGQDQQAVTEISQPAANQVDVSITNVTANAPVEVELPSTAADSESGTSLTGVTVTSRVSTNVNISVERSTTVPENTPAIDEDGPPRSFGYFSITADVSDENIESTQFTVTVSKTRIENAGTSPENVVVSRYNENEEEWRALETSVVGESSDSYTFSAVSPGFSVYAISYSESQETTTTQSETTATSTAQSTTGQQTSTATTAMTETTGDEPTGDDGDSVPRYILAIVIIVAVIAGGYYYYQRS